ncbi:hypothetical protein VTN96DRAFT_6358 [Rasamsonia emersonii]
MPKRGSFLLICYPAISTDQGNCLPETKRQKGLIHGTPAPLYWAVVVCISRTGSAIDRTEKRRKSGAKYQFDGTMMSKRTLNLNR